ncbi:unnamed protein product [Linum trigynum]|uniref:Homeobox domain-containing protein n=1 Tax=Linum trigynum TaxID=586398 RepID=A0AAV2EEM3_9ROSI
MATYYTTISSSPTGDLQTPSSSSCQLETNLSNNSHLNTISICSYSDILSGATTTSLSPNHHHADEFSTSQFGPTRNNEMMFIPPLSSEVPSPDLHPRNVDANLTAAEGFHIQGGLSLSLGTQMGGVEAPSFHHYQYSVSEPEEELILPASLVKWNNHNNHGGGGDVIKMEGGGGGPMNNPPDHFLQGSESNNAVEVYETFGYANVSLFNSRYLNATHELLDEVVNVKYALAASGEGNKCSDEKEGNERVASVESDGGNSSSTELSPSKKQDLQSKKIKLVSMIDEVDRRYKQYYHQMQALVTSLDMVAGNGVAKSYTALTLQTISRRFRSLRDAIGSQLDAIRRKLGEPKAASRCIPRLRYVEQQLRQQRALQQLGVMRHAWRPQRGLPENSVTVLRAWLFEHFLHPYPNDAEKLMLAKQTGLSRNQVANWFINARVRLWKPMVEEMYKEECGGFGDSDANSKSSNDEPNRIHGGATLDQNQYQRHDHHHHHLVVGEHDLQDTAVTSSPSLAADHHHFLHHNSNSMISFHQETMQPQSRPEIDHDQDQGLRHYVVAEQSTLPLNLNAGDGSLMSAAVQYGGVSEMNAGLLPATLGGTHHRHVSLALGLQHNETDGGDGGEMVDYHNCLDGKAHEQHHRFGSTVHLLHDFVVSKNPCF